MALAILEAMSAGLPVVATRGCYMTEAAATGALIQCEQGASALASAVAPLLADRQAARALGVAAQAHAHHVHDWEALARATLRLYAEAPVRA
jgi:glycosyltransferase involved in cell wall biosynthesis